MRTKGKIYRCVLVLKACMLCYQAVFAVSIQNAFLGINVAVNTGTNFDMAFDMGTSASYSPPNEPLLYQYSGINAIPSGTSNVVVKIDGTVYPFYGAGVVSQAQVSGGNEIHGTKILGGIVNANVRWKLVPNPATGINNDTMQIKFILHNLSASVRRISLRLMLDTMVAGNDGTNISVDNGFSVVADNTVWYKNSGGVPQNWWDYDISPLIGTPALVGRGYNYGNSFNEPATHPDVFEIADWNLVRGTAQWSVAPAGPIGSDSAVVLWYTNGAGGMPADLGYPVAAGQSITFVAYYGLNQEQLLTTPTFTRTYTATATATPSFTETFTHTPQVSPTVTQTVTPSHTHSMTHTITPTHSVTPTLTITPTPTATMVPFIMSLEGNFPNPFDRDTNIVFWLSRDAAVNIKIFSVSGELVALAENIEGVAGYNNFYYNGRNRAQKNLASGVFIYMITGETVYGEKAQYTSKFSVVK